MTPAVHCCYITEPIKLLWVGSNPAEWRQRPHKLEDKSFILKEMHKSTYCSQHFSHTGIFFFYKYSKIKDINPHDVNPPKRKPEQSFDATSFDSWIIGVIKNTKLLYLNIHKYELLSAFI